MASDLGQTNGGGATKPLPETTPPARQGEPSWMLQTIMELQKSVGELIGTVNGLAKAVDERSTRIDDMREKVDGLAEKVDGMRGGLGVARWFVGTLIGIGGLLGMLLWRLPAIIEALRAGSGGG